MCHKTRVVIRFRAKKNYHSLPEILHWYACGADRRSLGWSVGVQLRDYQISQDG